MNRLRLTDDQLLRVRDLLIAAGTPEDRDILREVDDATEAQARRTPFDEEDDD